MSSSCNDIGYVAKDQQFTNLQVKNNLSVQGTLRARNVITCSARFLDGSINGSSNIENAIITNADIANGLIEDNFIQNIVSTDFRSGCTVRDHVTSGDAALDTDVAVVDMDSTRLFMRIDRIGQITAKFGTIILSSGTTRGTVFMDGLPGRSTPFTSANHASGTGTIAKAGTGPASFGGMFGFAEARIGTTGVNIYWIGDSTSPGNAGAPGGAITIIYETDGPSLC